MSENPAFQGAAYQALLAKYGGLLETKMTAFAGSSFVQCCGPNSERVGLLIMNLNGSNTLYVAPNATPTTAQGIALPAGSGGIWMDVDQDGPLPAQAWASFQAAGLIGGIIIEVYRVSQVNKGGA